MKASFLPYSEGWKPPLGGRRFDAIANLMLFESIESTNEVGKSIVEWILNESENLAPTAIIAAHQTAGHGRAGRSWTSPGGASLAISLIVPWPAGPERVRVPLQIGIALARGLTARFGFDVRMKWPNDLLHGRKKLGGILVEARSGDEGEGFAVIGVGLNLTATAAQLSEAGLPDATSLHLAGAPLEALLGEAPIVTVLEILDAAIAHPVESIPEGFAEVTAHAPGDILVVEDGGRRLEGRYAGVTVDGLLRLATASGDETIVSGDVTLF